MLHLLKKGIALFLLGMILIPSVLVASSSQEMLVRSGLRLDYDGVDEAGKSGNDPTGNTNTSGSIACWVQFDTNLSSNNIETVFGMGGDDTDQATNFGQIIFGRRFNTAAGISNKLEFFHRIDNTATLNRVYGNTTLSSGVVYLVGASSNGSTWVLSVNGVDETLTTASGSNTGDWFGDIGTVGTRHYSIGNSWRDGTWGATFANYKGDTCMTWSSTLATADFLRLYNSGKPLHPCALNLCANLENVWPFGEMSGFGGTVTTMRDIYGSGTTDDFTMENMESADIVRAAYY